MERRGAVAACVRARVDPRPNRSAALRPQGPELDALLARSQPALAPYDFVEPTADVTRLLDEIEQDPTCIFWG